jgi:iron complex outermembrane recepter protein
VPGVGNYTLGQLDLIGSSTITNEAMWTFNKNSLDQAVGILPGVTMQNSGGSRNERDILVRGFDRFRVPLYMDGVRIYLPYDNRLDINRFLTPDLSEVQVEKGYVSVLNGPGGEGGAINLVSRKPTKEIELEGRSGVIMSGDLADLNQWSSYAYAGTRQKGYYGQVSGTIVDQYHFNMSDGFVPSTTSNTNGFQTNFPYEDGGLREHSNFEDWRVNAKAGITPNSTDEYSLNYTTQHGEKGAPLSVDRQVVQGYFLGNNRRFWDWPIWDVSTLSELSKTQLGEASYIKTNAYYNRFDNTTTFFRTPAYTTKLQDSPYHDASYGGFVEAGTNLIPMNTLKGVVHYRLDAHAEGAFNYDANGNFSGQDPKKKLSEDTWSFAAENTLHATRYFDFVTGVSYDIDEVLRADGNSDPLPEKNAWNWQCAAIYSYSKTGKVHADVSSRTRFPTLFDRYSTRFGSRPQNPFLNPERATNYEIGVSDTLFKTVQLSSAVFYSGLKDSIQNAFSGPNGNNSIVIYNADGDNYGFELSADWGVMRGVRICGNYTYLQRNLDFAAAAAGLPPGTNPTVTATAKAAIAGSAVEGSPRHEAFIYLAWNPWRPLTLTPSVELASDRTALITSCASTLTSPSASEATSGLCSPTGAPNAASALPSHDRVGSYALVNFQAEYAFDADTTVAVGGTNLLDENYELAQGFPEAGRMFFANMRARF